MDPISSAVQALVQARRSGGAVSAAQHPLADDDAAYAVQAGVARELGWFASAPPSHWKSGGPSREAVLTHAPLPPPGAWASPASGSAWPLRLRGIEAEVALRLGRDVDARQAAGLDVESARAWVDAMCVSIEIVESRWAEGIEAPAPCKLADLQSHGALVLGAWRPFEARDWARQVCRVTIGPGAEQRFTGTHSLGDPAFLLPAWLRHATRDGAVVKAGTVVTTGTWCGLPFARPGDLVEVVFDGMGSASVRV
ncbi:fumarylacetoacetate hydrolase family protein [Aquincola sp. MAHUQ-54]|uniref:Fumarylacetoacetate hydrolase family protein n=1 Tax=Aquincola agrisoli TaxID=3119538 RepID=A0AAW9QKE9_9BURK